MLKTAGLVDQWIQADARDALALSAAVANVAPGLADLVVNCVNVPGTELSSILCAKDEGTVYFFSMSTSFTAAALGAEGVGKDVTMIVGNGYAKGHAEIALQTLRDNPPVHDYFNTKYAGGRT
jgi:L-erythro-3,5-diaminohexanoate dehydrogenase